MIQNTICQRIITVLVVVLAILVTARAQTPPTSMPAADIHESFMALREGSIEGQNGWLGNGNNDALVQTQVNATVGGKAVRLNFPDGGAKKTLIPRGMSGTVEVDFRVRLDREGDKEWAKVLFSFNDNTGKTGLLLFHHEVNSWGVQSNGNWMLAADVAAPGAWQSLRVVLNYSAHQASVLVGEGAKWRTLFNKVAFTDATAANFSQFSVMRNGQGNPAPVYLDEILVRPMAADAQNSQPSVSLKADTPAKLRYGIFNAGESVEVAFEVQRRKEAAPDRLNWQLYDWTGAKLRQGELEVAGMSWQGSIRLEKLPAGYFEMRAKLQKADVELPVCGSRPAGMITFGMLPPIVALPLRFADDSRFGIYGTTFIESGRPLIGDPYSTYGLLGIHWTETPRCWTEMEPERFGQFQPSKYTAGYKSDHRLASVVNTVGTPVWATDWPDGKAPSGKLGFQIKMAYPPKDWEQYGAYLTKVAREQDIWRKSEASVQQRNYYYIHSEPDWHWKGTDEQFIHMYKVAHEALHRGDPNAVLLGPRYGVLAKGVEHLERLLPKGLGNYLDGIATHAYYLPPQMQVTPEAAGVPGNLRRLRELMTRYLKPGAMLLQGEWGTQYGVPYDAVTPEMLRRHAALFVRGHLIALGEGANTTFFFYTADYNGEVGYGLTFNLTMPNPDFGATAISPKPTFMAASALTRLLEGTRNEGRLDLDNDFYAYRFARGTEHLVALWNAKDSPRTIKLRTDAASVQVFDFMGNVRDQKVEDGIVTLTVDGSPIYVLGARPFAS